MKRKILWSFVAFFVVWTMVVISGCKRYNKIDAGFEYYISYNIDSTVATIETYNYSSYAEFYEWRLYRADGTIYESEYSYSPNMTVRESGSYRLLLVASNSKYSDTYDVYFTITLASENSGNVTPPDNPVASPTASFDINSSNGNYAPTTIQCNNTSTNAITYKWTLTKPDHTSVTSTLKNPSFTCSQAGTYTLELIAYNSNNVSSTNSQTITLVTPSTYTITYLKLQQIPMLASDNSSWDTGFFDGADPDIFFTILDSNGTILYTSSTKSNTAETSLPVTWNGVNLTLDYSSNYTIRFYDSDDGIDDNDLMAGCNFISSYLTPGNNSYTWTGQTNGTKFTVGLRW
ncbi:MAG: hypothetical protein J5542_08910 [Bacteroidales bacterium]|nr:hypothetical protein [Bacteroidales bacterium]